MNIQKQDIEVVNQETQWQAPELIELGDISSVTQVKFRSGHDGSSLS